ncbi:ARF GAP-like zinc finger-containing protein ZIGA4 [Rhynchospora pubera]|uniref:ARF GAP-like zinc finger-containing protein ZIGA4 n=1 Tax=Rhynchospora pubera TaxID=906938 RepID=A0AAV8DJS8_9POAL|nr:ARF GAP-like zinc finger-containing protein ZIGA4 [Rhynchospora pubera]
MSSKKEEERNEKIIRGLMKLPPNRRCINCNSAGPQYVCTNFWTFVCLSCSGIHREFTHRVKSVSMAKFTKQEVEALQQGGNQRARDIYLKNWDMTRMRLPDSSNADRIRDFIRSVYVNKKYAGESSSEKPPRDVESQSLKATESDLRRPNSYHSFSQSPPYDNQYEERRYGKSSAQAPRRLASDRGYEGKVPSFLFSPGRLHENVMFDDRFANESSGSRLSDFSVSSAGDQFRYDTQSPNSQIGYPSPNAPYQPNRPPNARPQRTVSSGSFGSFDSNSLSESTSEHQPVQLTSGSQQLVTSPSSQLPPLGSNQVSAQPTLVRPAASFNQRSAQEPTASTSSGTSVDLFAGFNEQNATRLNRTVSAGPAVTSLTEVGPASTSIDLFAGFNNQPREVAPTATSIDLFAGFNNQPPVEVKNEGWANFDFSQKSQVPVANTTFQSSPVMTSAGNIQSSPVLTSAGNDLARGMQTAQSAPIMTSAGNDLARGMQTVISQVPVSSATAPPQVPQTVAKPPSVNQERFQPWNAFVESSASGTYAANTQLQMPLPQMSMPGLAQVSSGPSAQFSSLVPVSGIEVAQLSSQPGVQLPVENSMAREPAQPQTADQWFASASDAQMLPYQGVSQEVAKSDIHSVAALNSISGFTSLTGEIPASFQPSQSSRPYDVYAGHVVSKDLESAVPSLTNVPANVMGTMSSQLRPLQEMPYQMKSTNPFDFADESDLANSTFMDMTSLQAALPVQQPAADYYSTGAYGSQFYTQNPASTYASPMPQGGIPQTIDQAPNPQILSSIPQGYPSLGSNPFA